MRSAKLSSCVKALHKHTPLEAAWNTRGWKSGTSCSSIPRVLDVSFLDQAQSNDFAAEEDNELGLEQRASLGMSS